MLLLLFIRIPVIIYGLPLTEAELNWMLVGERMHEGFQLYTGIWDTISPLSALVYWFADWQFGRSQLAYQVLALVLTAGQVALFNFITVKNQLYPEKTYLPGLFYVVLVNVSFDFFTLSPALMATTFLLMALDKLFIQIDQRAASDRVFESGFYLAVATLFYLPAGVFILFALFALLFFGSSDFKQYFLLLFGFAFPLGLAILAFYLIGNYEGFIRQFGLSLFTVKHQYYVGLPTLLLLFVFPTVLVFLGLSKVAGSMRYINYQKRCQQIMVVYLIFAVISILITPQLTPAQFMVTVPGVSFFATPYFFMGERKWIGEAVFGGFLLMTLLWLFTGIFPFLPGNNLVMLDKLKVQPSSLKQPIRGKKMLVLGEGLNEYQGNTAATPYLNWQLSKSELLNLDDYQSVINVYHNFEKDLPDVIIDRQRTAELLFNRMPALARHYKPGEEKGVYFRKR